jgi:hypothetical protein
MEDGTVWWQQSIAERRGAIVQEDIVFIGIHQKVPNA